MLLRRKPTDIAVAAEREARRLRIFRLRWPVLHTLESSSHKVPSEWLLLVLLPAGLGSGVQHPLSSSMVSRAYEEGPRRLVLGTYSFSGDLGKMALPATAALIASLVGWRWATRSVGMLALAPTFYGFVSDWGGVQLTLSLVGLMVMVAIPLATLLRLPQVGDVNHVD